MSTDTTRAPGAQPADAPAIAFDPTNPDHQRAWQSVLSLGRDEAERPPREAQEADERTIKHFADALALYMNAQHDLLLQEPADSDDEYEAETDRLTDALTAAEEYVMAHSAPDWRALLAKLEIAVFDGRVTKPDHIDSIRADIMRLADIDRSPTFLPLEWLMRFERAGGGTSLVKGEEGLVPVLSAATNAKRAHYLLRELRSHERTAIGEHLLKHLDPADYGLTVEA